MVFLICRDSYNTLEQGNNCLISTIKQEKDSQSVSGEENYGQKEFDDFDKT